jgi:multiple antibiotic resistance protein
MFWFTVSQLLVLTAPGCFIPVILALTPGKSGMERVRIAFVACFVAAAVLATFALCGSYVLEFFGFSLSAFKVAGGIYVALVGIGLLFDTAGEEQTATNEEVKMKKSSSLGVAIAPLAIPLLAGPGMISVVVTRCAESGTLGGRILLVGSIAATFAAFLVIVSAAVLGARYIGKFALDVVGKFTGVYALSFGFLVCFSGTTAFIGI